MLSIAGESAGERYSWKSVTRLLQLLNEEHKESSYQWKMFSFSVALSFNFIACHFNWKSAVLFLFWVVNSQPILIMNLEKLPEWISAVILITANSLCNRGENKRFSNKIYCELDHEIYPQNFEIYFQLDRKSKTWLIAFLSV